MTKPKSETLHKRRVWSVKLIVVDRPPFKPNTKVQDKFLTKKELLKCLSVATGYANVTPSVVDATLELR